MASQRWCSVINTCGQGKHLYKEVPAATTQQKVAVMWGSTFFHVLDRAIDTGVWNGYSYEDAPTMTIPR